MWVLMENPLETRMDASDSNDTASARTASQAVFLRPEAASTPIDFTLSSNHNASCRLIQSHHSMGVLMAIWGNYDGKVEGIGGTGC